MESMKLFTLMIAIPKTNLVNSCPFDDFPGRVFQLSPVRETYKASGPKCRSLCYDNIKCVSVNVVLIRGWGFRCDVMYNGPTKLSDLVENPDAVLYVKRGE